MAPIATLRDQKSSIRKNYPNKWLLYHFPESCIFKRIGCFIDNFTKFFQLSSFQPASFFLNPIADFMGCFSVFLR
jgi:hypothetical protein